MEVDSTFASELLDQLRNRNAQERSFCGIIEDYQVLLNQNRELQVRNGQLDKEAGELRLENSMLSESIDLGRVAAANSKEVVELRETAKRLQEELNSTYKEKSRLAEELVTATRQLQIVRENFERNDKTLNERSNTIKDLRANKKDLVSQIDHLKTAQEEAVSELESRLKAKESAEQRAEAAEADNAELSRRLVEMKMTEIDRVNEVNKICNEMMHSAQSMERAAAAELISRPRHILGKFFNAAPSRDPSIKASGTSGLVEQLKDVTMRGSLVQSRVPTGNVHSVPSHEGGCYALAFDRSGARLASAGADGVVRLWEAAAAAAGGMAPGGQLHGMKDPVADLCFTCDQAALLAAGCDRTLRLWDLASARVRHTLTGHSDKVSSVSCSPVDQKWAVSGGADRAIKTWDLSRGFVASTIIHASRCHSVRWAADGALLVSGHLNGSLCFWDRRSHKAVHEVAGLHTQQIVSVAAGLQTGVVLTCGKDCVLKLVDVRSFQVRQEMRAAGFQVGNVWCSAALAADDRHAAAGSTDGTVFVWQTEGGQVVKSLKPKGGQGVLAASWSPQGSPLVTSDRTGNISFWEG